MDTQVYKGGGGGGNVTYDNSCLPGERHLQNVFVPLFLGPARAIYHANSTISVRSSYKSMRIHYGRKQRTLRVPWTPDQDRLLCGGTARI